MSDTPASRRERIKALFASAISLAPAARVAVLDDACGDDTALRREVQTLLDDYEAAQQFFAQFPSDLAREAIAISEAPRVFSTGSLVSSRFRIAGFLGAGGMGEVYEAEDLFLDRAAVAIKTLPAAIAADAQAVARLKREMALARQVTHPNVCRVFDVYQHEPESGPAVAFFTMELLPGETLAARLRRTGPCSTDTAIAWIDQMAAGLGAAHAAGIVHGDFKPGNVLLVPGLAAESVERLVITDFGLARRAPSGADSQPANTGAAWGTPIYMAPEQFAGRRATPATDVYALAAVSFELVTGRPAFETNPADAAGLDPAWRSAIVRGLQRDPVLRFQTADAFLQALTASTSRTTSDTFMGTARRRWSIAAVVLACLVLASLLLMPQVRAIFLSTPPAAAIPAASQQSIAVLPFGDPDGSAEDRDLARGLAPVLHEQLGAMAGASRVVFVPVSVAGEGVPDAQRIHRTIGADAIVTGRVERAGASRRITIELRDASVQPAVSIGTSRVEIREGEPIVPVVRAELARLLAMRTTPSVRGSWDPAGVKSAEAEAWYLRGRGYLGQGRAPGPDPVRLDLAGLDLAGDAFQRAIDLDPRYAAPRAALAETLVLTYETTRQTHKDTQLLDRAERSADEASRLQPGVAQFQVVRALTSLATGQHDRAIPALEEALRLDPGALGAREHLARSYIATGQLTRAEQTLEEGIQRHPRYWAAHEDLGVFRLNRGQYKQAEPHFLAGRQFAPDHPRVISNLAAFYTMTEAFDAAEQELIRGLALAPDPLLYNNLGWAYFYQGEFAKGVESLTRAVALASEDSVVLAGLARGYRWMARTREARAARDQAITVARKQLGADPHNVEVRANLAYLYAESAEFGEARRQIELALEDAPANARVRFMSALVFELSGARAVALDALESAIDGGHPKYQIAHHPDLRALRSDDRYVQLVGRVAWAR